MILSLYIRSSADKRATVHVAVGALLLGLGMVFFFPVVNGKQIFLSHLIFFAFCLLSVIRFLSVKNRVLFYGLVLVSLVSLVATFFSARYMGGGDRFEEDYVKVLIYFILVPLLARTYSPDFFSSVLQWFFSFFPICFLLIVYFFDGDAFSYSGRFYIEQFGSPNVFGVFAALALICLIFSGGWILGNFVRAVLILFYVLILVITASRAAMLGVFLAFFLSGVRSYSRLFAYVMLFACLALLMSAFIFLFAGSEILALQKFNFYEDITEKGMSYRFDVWRESFLQWWSAPPLAWLFGYGPGRVIMVLFAVEAPILHPHNTFLFFLYSYGLFGFVIFTAWLFWISKSAVLYDGGNGRLVRATTFFYVFIFAFDVHLSASQFLPFHVVFLSLLVSILNKRSFHG